VNQTNSALHRARVVIAEYFPQENAVTVKRFGVRGAHEIVSDNFGAPILVRLGYRSDISESLGIRSGDYGYVDYEGQRMVSGLCYLSPYRGKDAEANTYRPVGGGLAII